MLQECRCGFNHIGVKGGQFLAIEDRIARSGLRSLQWWQYSVPFGGMDTLDFWRGNGWVCVFIRAETILISGLISGLVLCNDQFQPPLV